MKILRTVIFLALFALLSSVATADQKTVELPAQMYGSWDSDVGAWSGGLYIRIHNKKAVAPFKGEIRFEGSDCDYFASFKGMLTLPNTLTLKADLGGACGDATITLRRVGKGKWKGTYDADYPDSGRIGVSAY